MTPRIPLFKVWMGHGAVSALRQTLHSGFIAEGPRVAEFEGKFADWLGGGVNALAVSSCTAALHLALELANVRGGEVISTAMTAEPTNTAILQAGGRVVWADVDPLNGNLSPQSIAERITPDTRAIMVVHYGGVPVQLQCIRNIAEQHGIPVIEDAAHALGAKYNGVKIGNHSEFVCFSFQAIKHMPTGDGGMLIVKDIDQLPRARRLRWFGIDRQASRTEVDVAEGGYKYNMTDITATLGLNQLRHVDSAVLAKHIANGKYFDRMLQGIPGLDLCEWEPEAEPSYWFYTVLADKRDDLARMLTEKGIGNSQAHKRNDWHSVFAASKRDLPGLDSFYARMLHIPCGWWVKPEDREYIAETLRGGW